MKKRWWHNKTAYQIYPKSFYDSNGDGIGDLRGIIQKLDYLKDLGIGIVWISPIYQSPFIDQGYDISDYYAIDPAFGTMEDMDELLREAKKRDIAIVMDLVVNHCSDQHEWFQKALKDPFGPYGEYFYIREGKDGNPPCNWRSYFGGSVWEPLPGYDNLFYLHMFAKEQPDLNWENPALRQEIYKMIRWWLEKGVAGFRIDAIINIKKDLRFEDFPADREDGMCAAATMLASAHGILDFLMEMKKEAFAPYNAFTIGELFDFDQQELKRYIGEDGCFESIFDFAPHLLGGSDHGWYNRRPVTMDQFRDAVFASKAISQEIGMMANIIENHDEPRGVSRYLPAEGQTEQGKKLLAAISLMSFGLPFIYQGQEIGMTNKTFRSIEEVDDISTLDEYQVALEHGYTGEGALALVAEMSRDNARTPMQWSEEAHGGFTTGTPWLPVNENYQTIHVKEQESQENSLLSFYKKLIALRTAPEYEEAIVYGSQEPFLEEETNLTAFCRKGQEKNLLILANTCSKPRTITLPAPIKKVLLNNYAAPLKATPNHQISLQSYQLIILETT